MADFSRTYNEHDWVNDTAPSISASNLNEIDDFISELDDRTKELYVKGRSAPVPTIRVIDSLDSTSKTDALSANMGHELGEDIDSLVDRIGKVDATSVSAKLKADECEERIIVIEDEIGQIAEGISDIKSALQAL